MGGGGLVGGRGRGINGKVVTLPSNIGSFWPVTPQTFLCNLSITQSRLSSSTTKKQQKGGGETTYDEKYESHILEPRHDEIAVKDATFAVAKRKLKKIQDCRDSNSYLYDTSRYGGRGQHSNQLSCQAI